MSVNVSQKGLIVPPGLCFKTRVGAQPLIWKSFLILIQGFRNSEVAYWGLVRPRKSNPRPPALQSSARLLSYSGHGYHQQHANV